MARSSCSFLPRSCCSFVFVLLWRTLSNALRTSEATTGIETTPTGLRILLSPAGHERLSAVAELYVCRLSSSERSVCAYVVQVFTPLDVFSRGVRLPRLFRCRQDSVFSYALARPHRLWEGNRDGRKPMVLLLGGLSYVGFSTVDAGAVLGARLNPFEPIFLTQMPLLV